MDELKIVMGLYSKGRSNPNEKLKRDNDNVIW